MPLPRLWDGHDTPLFKWNETGGTWDSKQKRHVYPKSKDLPDAPNALQRLCDIEKRVTAVLNMIDYNTGNIHRLIAEDLASPAAEGELALLPILDYCFPEFSVGVSEQCKDMLREKVKRYQRQHAHNLALDKSIDIAFKWQCSRRSPQPVRYLPADELANVKIAEKCSYKSVDWNFEHSNERYEGTYIKQSPSECYKPVNSPPSTHKGGFYTCVISELKPKLENLSKAWTSNVEVIVAPKLMTDDEQKEMADYHAARKRKEDLLELENLQKKEQMKRWAEEDERRKGPPPKLPHHEVVRHGLRKLGF